MKILIIIAFALIVVDFFASVIHFCRCGRAFKKYKVCKQELDELIKRNRE